MIGKSVLFVEGSALRASKFVETIPIQRRNFMLVI